MASEHMEQQWVRDMTPDEIRADELANLLSWMEKEDVGPRGIANQIRERIDSLTPELDSFSRGVGPDAADPPGVGMNAP